MRIYLAFPNLYLINRPFKAYRAGDESKLRPLKRCRVLFSYHYMQDEDMDRVRAGFGEVPCDIIADSGAYSAWSLGTTINVAEYAAWLNRWKHIFTAAAALDVIGNAAASFKQTEQLRMLVPDSLDIVPVYHSNDEGGFSYLHRYIDAGYRYIGISPTGAIYGAPRLYDAWASECFKRRPPHVGYHGFGVTGYKVIRKFPWYSVDSSSWASSLRYAVLQLWDKRACTVRKIPLRDHEAILHHSHVLADYGLDPSDVRASALAKGKIILSMFHSYRAIEEYLDGIYGQRTPQFHPETFP